MKLFGRHNQPDWPQTPLDLEEITSKNDDSDLITQQLTSETAVNENFNFTVGENSYRVNPHHIFLVYKANDHDTVMSASF